MLTAQLCARLRSPDQELLHFHLALIQKQGYSPILADVLMLFDTFLHQIQMRSYMYDPSLNKIH